MKAVGAEPAADANGTAKPDARVGQAARGGQQDDGENQPALPP